MAETLTLTTPETFPPVVSWHIVRMFMDLTIPAIKLELASDIGTSFTWRLIPDADTTPEMIQTGLDLINQGDFMVVQGQTLQQWLLEQLVADGAKEGTVTP